MKELSCVPKSKFLQVACLAALAAAPAQADEKSTILADGPKAYYRFNDNSSRDIINFNIGSLGAAGNASNDLASVTGGFVHSIPGAIVGDADRAAFFDFTTRTEIPFDPAMNPPATQPFTVEAWLLPSSDAVNNGMGALCNRWTQGGGRQGWVMYQRAPDTNHCTSCGPGVGWEFRMYNGVNGSGQVDVTSGVPFALGEWQHVVVVYEPIGGNATNSQAIIYINGVAAATNVNSSASLPGYAACTGDHDPAPNGQPAMSLGGYNNANSGTYGFANPWFGGVDEFAFYSAKLTPAQILSHYQNGTNANRGQSYESLVQAAHPVAYLRLNEVAPNVDIANNSGDLRSTAIGTHSAGVKHPATGALVSNPGDGAASYHQRNGHSTTDIPYLDKNNPNAGVPFTFETWLRPTSDRQNPGAAPVNNRYVSSGNRTGWVIFQRAPDVTYSPVSGYSGVGWNFRMYSGVGSSGQDVTTGTDYNVDQWQHFVVTWEPYQENGDTIANGNDQWVGVLTAYFNGVPVATNAAAKYSANVPTTEDGTDPADLAVGGYNAASGLGSNPFEGEVDELAFYNGIVLSTNQIWAHYLAGTQPNYGTNYATLVYSAGLFAVTNSAGQTVERATLPPLYLRFNDSAYFGAANAGTLGAQANGSLVNTTNIATGPQSPEFKGFDATNAALTLDGTSQFASLNNPAGLNINGQITLEAWVQPAATLPGSVARIISHGPELVTSYPVGYVNAVTNTSEVYLRIDGNGANYSVGSAQYSLATGNTDTHQASAPVPAEDLTGSAWVHLVGTYDGSAWNLYRNGVLVASQASAVGAVPVGAGDWAIGATGQGWADNFAGNVGDVAIYDKALSAAQVASHFAAAKVGTSGITITPAPGGKVTVTWPAGTTLQSATKLSGPYTNVTGSPVSPLTVSAAAAKFYRWVLQ